MAKTQRLPSDDPGQFARQLIDKLGVDAAAKIARIASGEESEAFVRRVIKLIAGPSPSPEAMGWLDEFEFCVSHIDPSQRLETLAAVEAALAVAVFSPPDEAVVNEYRNRRAAQFSRPNAISPFTKFFMGKIKRNPSISPRQLKAALLSDAQNGESGTFQLSDDQTEIIYVDNPKTRLKIANVDSAVSKALSKLKKNEFPLTG
ncbi:hypothetical protein [Methylocystis sp. SB2]|uniref:hypothetical protein n=1 Tax=Methylocystis sp. (strain SB2) TaxID=743836 RepID=UPI0004A3B5E8|nr:hypothetical protein [Methylocystis sp. SB2]ULO23139.1 hypothetical protein LNB28_13415 [Methylocystis sp. SB2]